jgi:hypothetical protein
VEDDEDEGPAEENVDVYADAQAKIAAAKANVTINFLNIVMKVQERNVTFCRTNR